MLALGGTAGAAVPKKPSDVRGENVAVNDPNARFVPGELLVRFRSDVSPAARAAALQQHNAQRKRDLPVRGLVLAQLASGQNLNAAIAALAGRPDVLYAERNWIYRKTATPNDPRFASGELWGLHQATDVDIDAPEAWDTTTGSSNVVVAVVDTGVAYDHPDLAPNIWSNPGEVAGNGIDDDGNGHVDDIRGWDFIDNDSDPRDFEGHGTHVAGTIGARGNNATGVVGVNWNVKIMPVRVLGPSGGTNATVTSGFAYAAAEGAKVVNASLGGGGFSSSMQAAIDAATGTLFVVAAGNDGTNNETTPQYPCNYTSVNLVCVAATTRTDGLASFSNRGTTSVDLGAPGTEILSTWPTFQAVFGDGFEADGVWAGGGVPGPWARTGEAALSGSFSGTDSPGGSYANLTDNFFRSPGPISLAGRNGCHVQYALNLATEFDFDFLLVEGTSDLVNWQLAAAWTGSTGGSWFGMQDDLSMFDGAAGFHLRFALVSDDTIVDDGAHVDDVIVRCVGTSYTANDYAAIQGTSMATPHAAGVAALAWAKSPAATVAQVRSALLLGGDPIASLSGNTVTGRRLNANGTLALIAGPAGSCEGLLATIEGTIGADSIVGTAGDDVILAKEGNDTIDGGGGNDRICAGTGDDSIKGGPGNDIVNGDAGTDAIDYSGAPGAVSASLALGTGSGDGSDTLKTLENIVGSPSNDGLGGNDSANRIDGGGGNDTLSGRGGVDLLNGDDGADTLRGGPGGDTLNGGAGDDKLYGENDGDTLNGGDGADYLEGGFGADTGNGDGGNDVLYESSVVSGTDVLNGNDGIDSVSYWGRTLGVTLTIDGVANDGDTASGEGDAIAADVERLFGSTVADSLTGSAGDNNLYGGNGNDQLFGGGGNDFLDGGNDADVFDGQAGIDTAAYSARAVSVYVSLDGVANDGRDLDLNRVSEENDNVLASIEVVVGSSAPDILVGGPGADTLSGFGGNDRLEGEGGNDRLAGGDGNDQLLGGAGADSHEGGAGIDTGNYDGRAAALTVDMDDVADDGEAGEADNVRSDVEFLIGGNGDDTLTGSAAVNRIFGRGGVDTISGLGGDDHLLGEAGNDTLNGGDGNDTLDGGADTDTCVQGAGAGSLVSCEL